ncbi:Cytochrome P450 [Akanthomyces lecanii RCEF 1005]|uniref:Cytochrome P450 n=1 Tax=Akanthomyces lecanii RCEF 1005 TaxID=1081108 RepID=A0A168KG26_CORDF|nr:Cytochrome P450 [Akanthomyces lecanii RCEF 1005]
MQSGDIVRLGPSTISVSKLEAVHVIHGPSVARVHDPAVHAQRRVSWERGLNSAALRNYKPIVTQTTHNLMDRINASQGQVFNASKWFNLFSVEIMGWMAFGRSFDALATGKETYFMELIHESEPIFGTVVHVSWLFILMKQIPFLAGPFNVFGSGYVRNPYRRCKHKSPPGTSCNLFSTLLEDYPSFEELTEKQRLSLEGDMFVIVIAGSETVTQEIDEYFVEHDEADPVLLSKMGYLQACINETLRLWPPVPSGAQRITPPEGIHVGDAFIPGNTLCMYPQEEAFPRPNEFVPERWTTKPELIADRSVYCPFSAGKYSCVGKQLALVELRQVAVEVLRRYTVELAPGFTSRDFEGGLRDRFSTQAKRLDLVFKTR